LAAELKKWEIVEIVENIENVENVEKEENVESVESVERGCADVSWVVDLTE
jgi:hypothetical protein